MKSRFGKNEFRKNGFEKNGFEKNGFGKNGFEKNGFGKNEFGKNEFGKNGFGKNEFGKNEFGKNGFGKNGFEKNGFGKNEFGKNKFGKSEFVRKIFSAMLCAVPVLCVILFAGENTAAEENQIVYPVVIEDSLFFTAEPAVSRVQKGQDCAILLSYNEDYAFLSCSAGDYEAEETEEGTLLTIRNVNSAVRVSVKSEKKAEEEPETVSCTISYDANGGSFSDPDEKGGSVRTKICTLSYHIRPNTDIGEGLTREGYTLTGWNTKADGTGTHIGLGSRTDADTKILYAEWAEWADPSLFTTRRNETGVTITGYRGEGELSRLVIPAEIDGMKVTVIAGSFTTNMPCKTIEAEQLILPDTLKTVENGAFSHAVFQEICFADTLESMGETAFAENPKTLHINAAKAPVYQKENPNARFADNLDLLMTASEERVMVLFSGCSFSYGVQSDLLEEAFPEYRVINMGVIGGINAAYQIECILNYLKEGDVFVHAPEEMSAYQLLSDISCDYRMFITAEGNYDLLSLADFSDYPRLWKSYNTYVEMRSDEKDGSYEDGGNLYNRYGDIALARTYDEKTAFSEDVSRSDGEYVFSDTVLTESGMDRLCGYYDRMREAGISVYISYAPVNENGLADLSGAEEFETNFCAMLKVRGYEPVSVLEDYLFPGRFFYDSDYHMNDGGTIVRTQQLIKDLQPYLEEEKSG